MKKMLEIEYVGVEDVQEIMDDCYALMKDGHFANVDFHNAGDDPICAVNIMLGGFDKDKNYSYKFLFSLTDRDYDVNKMNECKAAIKNLLVGNKNETIRN